MKPGHPENPSSATTTGYAAGLVASLVRRHPELASEIAADPDSVEVPLLVTDVRPETRILACNSAFAEMCRFPREQILGGTPRILQGPDTDVRQAQNFARRARSEGFAGTVLLNYKGDGTPYYAEIMAVRCQCPDGLSAPDGDIMLAFERSLGDLEHGADAAPSRSDRLALLLEDVLRRYLQHNYQRGMHPAQWAALRYFRLAGPEQRTLSDFARHHHTTMGTASTTVSTLVGKGYLIKRGFRGPIELTPEGADLLVDDPLQDVSDLLARLDEDGRACLERVLLGLADRLRDGNGRA
jgi:DNA-binding MarR family transcriptional regulator